MADNKDALLPVEDEQQLAERMVGCLSGAMTCLMLCIGDKAGLYTKLHEVGPCTPAQLAQAAGLAERWVQEWLYQQASARLISTDKDAGTFWLNPAQANILAKEKDSPCYMMGLPTTMPTFFSKRDELVHCFRTGMGMTYDALGADCACGTHRELSVWVRHHLVKHIREMPELAAALDKGVLVADVGCGCGEALMVLAKAFPKSTFHGYDTSHHALHIAEQRIAAADLNNITLHNPDHGPEHSLPGKPTFTLVMVHDALHDMTRPDMCLKAIHGSLLREAPACFIAGDWRSLGSPAANIQQLPVATMMYGFSVAVCMSSALSAPGGLGLGTLGFDEAVAKKMMADAGFTAVEMLEWGSELNAYYLAKP